MEEEIKEIREIRELYKMNAEKLRNILTKKQIIERIVNIFEKSQYLKKEDLEEILIYEIPSLKKDLLFLLYLIDFQAMCIENILDVLKKL